MNKKQYNNVIENTLKHENTEDSLATARAIFDNMGVALPQGDMKTVYETISTDNYMGWKSCTMQEAQAAADKGVAAIGISEDRIVVLSATDEEQPVTETASVMTLDENTSAFAVEGMRYYSYSYGGTTCSGGCGTVGSNRYFNTNNTNALKQDFINLLGNKKVDLPVLDLFYVNTTSECIDIILQYDYYITCFANCFNIPKEMIQTILLRELWCLNTGDAIGDGWVMQYFQWKDNCEYWSNQSVLYQATVPYPTQPIPLKEDSSTGLGQIHAKVAIKAFNEAVDNGYINETKLDGSNWKVCKNVWFSLKNTPIYNIKMSTLNILSCINEYNYGSNPWCYTANQYKQIFTRYNANQNTINDYGRECYEYYLIFKRYN